MKARLLIGVLTCMVMLGILVGVGSVTNAKADDPGGLTCGGAVHSGSAFFGGGVWTIQDSHSCNSGKTYSFELQYNTQAAQTTWHDFGNDRIRTSGDCSTSCIAHYNDGGTIGCPTTGSIYQLRFKWWWQDGSIQTGHGGANAVCNNGVVLGTG